VDPLLAAVDIQVIEYSNGAHVVLPVKPRADQDRALVVATFAFLVWEVCITLADEVDFIWSYVSLSWQGYCVKRTSQEHTLLLGESSAPDAAILHARRRPVRGHFVPHATRLTRR
jgi:hypothetical protein